MNLIFEALSDQNRRKILELLYQKDMNVSEILKYFNFRQASLSHHLKVLKEAELVKSKKRWQYVYYSLNKKAIAKVIWFFEQFFVEELSKE